MSELYKLPTGWEWKDYKKVFENISSKPFQIPKSEYLDNGSFPIVDQSKDSIVGYSSDETKLHENKDNCVIFGDHTRQIKFVDFPFVIGADGTKILKSKNDDDIKFLYYQLLSKNIKSLGYSRHFKLVKEFRFAIPKPTEQKRIVAKLDSLFGKIDKAIELHQQNITSANTLMASTLDKTFKKLEGEYSLNNILDGVYVGCRKGYKPEIIDGKVPFIGMQDIDQYNGINTNYVLEDYEKVSKGKTKFEKNAVLVGKITPCTQNNKTSIVPSNINGGFATTEVYALHSKDNMNPFYLNYFVRSKDINDYLVSTMIGATGRQRVPSDAITSLKIPLPPLPIQQQTVEYLDSIATKVDKIKQLNEQKLENLKALKASILDKAFRGEL